MSIEPLPIGCPWSDFSPPTIQFCEQNLCSFITTPANTWSNLAYIFIGIYLFLKIRNHSKNRYLLLFSVSAILTGIFSFLYHASFTFFFQFFDLSSMYLFSSLLVALNLKRLYWSKSENQNLDSSSLILSDSNSTSNAPNKLHDWNTTFMFLILVLLSMTLLFFIRKIGIVIFGLHILAALSIEFWIFKKQKTFRISLPISDFNYYKNFLIAISLFAFALLIWVLD